MRWKLRAFSLVAALAAATLVAVASPAAASGQAHLSFTCTGSQKAITSVTVSTTTVVVSGTAANPCPDQVKVYGLDPSQAVGDWATSTAIATVTPAANGTFSATFPRFNGSADRLYAQFVAVGVSGGASTLLAGPHYSDSLSLGPANTSARFAPTTQKGLSVSMTGDAEELGIGHAAISVAVNKMMLATAGSPGDSISFVSQGTTYYFNKKFVEGLDRQIKPLSDNQILVYLVLVLIYDNDANSSFPVLHHPDAPSGAPASFVTYAFNTKTAAGIANYTAAMEFIASRYSRDDQAYGRSVDYIVGNEIQSAGSWQLMGAKTPAQFIDAYTPALRIAWEAAQKYYAASRVYTSLDRLWNVSAVPADTTHYYKGKVILDGIDAKVSAEGDFPWNVAFHPYPHDMFDPHVWNDPVTNDPTTTNEITFKNIAVLSDYLNTASLKYGGNRRHIILSEEGCQSPSNSASDQNLQAACFAYAYYKVLAAGGIDAFLWDPQVDNRDAVGLRMGLWTWDDNRPTNSIAPGSQKQIYNLFRDIDTSNSLTLTNFAKTTIGISNWTDVIPNWVNSMVDSRRTTTAMPVVVGGTGSSPTLVSGFESGLAGWRTADATSSVETIAMASAPQGSSVLRMNFDDSNVLKDNSINSKAWHGTDVVLGSPLNATSTPYLGVKVNLDPVGASAYNSYSVQVRAYGADGTVAYGTATVYPADGWTQVHVNLSGWSGRSAIQRIKVWVKGSYGDDWLGSMVIDDVSLSATVTAPSRIFDFESGAQGWVAGANVTSVSKVSSIPNGPQALHGGTGVLEAVMANGDASVPKVVSVTPGTAINASSATSIFAWVDAYGGVPGATGYEAIMTLHSGGKVISTRSLVNPDSWNKLSIDVSDWPYRSTITSIEISYHALGTTYNWTGGNRFQVDDIGAVNGTALSQTKNVLYTFEASGTSGWSAGGAVSSISRVTSFANGPGGPFEATASLDALLTTGAANVKKTVYVQPGSPLNLSTASTIYAWVDAYGGVPGATGYAVDITAYSGTESITGTNTFFVADAWNKVSVDVSNWALRNSITKIEISYRVIGSTYSWSGAHLQVDEVGYMVPTTAPGAPVGIFDFESGTQGWVAGSNVASVATVSSFPNGPAVPHGGSSALQATMNNGDASLAKSISVTPSAALNLSGASKVALWFDGYGGIPGATGYAVDVTVWSGVHSITGTLADYQSDRWSRVSVDVSKWPYRAAVTKVTVTYRVLGSTYSWTGGPKFQIDDVQYLP